MVALSEQGSWDLPLDRPIEIEHGDQRLATLGEVGAYILALPETLQSQELWRAAAETALEAAKSRSKRCVFGPVVSHPERRVSTTSAISASPIDGSANGRKVSRMA